MCDGVELGFFEGRAGISGVVGGWEGLVMSQAGEFKIG